MGAWIETNTLLMSNLAGKSHPTWVRGLKPSLSLAIQSFIMSHPTWVRGLKHAVLWAIVMTKKVAPYMGAWIETFRFANGNPSCTSHPTWVRGLKHNICKLRV